MIRQFLEESCRRDISSDAASAVQSKNCPAHPDYEIIWLKGVITCESGEHWERPERVNAMIGVQFRFDLMAGGDLPRAVRSPTPQPGARS